MEGNAVCNDGKRSFYHRTEHDPQRSSTGALLRSGLSERKGQGKIWPLSSTLHHPLLGRGCLASVADMCAEDLSVEITYS